MGYFQYTIKVEPEWRDILMAFLSALSFDSFEETPTGLEAFLPAEVDREAIEQHLSQLQDQYLFTYTVNRVPERNWNAVWESNFQPIRVGDFCGVRADFHPKMEDVRYEVVINPKMAFGTGHHETTYMMIELMQKLDFRQVSVLDYGSGTGILAILAAKMGAHGVEAVDIEEAAFENTRENAAINGVPSRVKAVHGTLDDCSGKLYDRILANINRNVILASLPALHKKLRPTGTLLISGILRTDEELIRTKADSIGFHLEERAGRGEWCCMKFSPGS